MKKHLLILGTLLMALTCVPVQAKTKAPAAPERLQADCKNEKTMTLKWKKVKGAKGYIVYRANGKKKNKFKRIANIKKTSSKWRKYTDKKCKKNHVYRYKVKAYKKRGKKLIKSSSSYVVTARTYGWNGKKVNPKKISVFSDLSMNICQTKKIEPYLTMDDKTGRASKLFDKTVTYFVSDPSLATISSDGTITTKDKDGSLVVTMRTCNGKQCSMTVTIIDYSKPKTFPGYKGEYQDVSLLLRDYRTDITEIAHYLTVHWQKGSTYMENGRIVGELSYDAETQKYVDHLMTYPGYIRVNCDEYQISFSILNDSDLVETVFYTESIANEKSYQIAPCWFVRRTLPI